MGHTITLYFISTQPILLEAFRQVLEKLPRKIRVVPIVADENLSGKAQLALSTGTLPDLAIVSLDSPSGDLTTVHALRGARYLGPILVICFRPVLPPLEELINLDVQSIVPSLSGLEELEAAIYDLADGHAEPLEQQYVRVPRTANSRLSREILNDREREVLQLVAEDLTDMEIAKRLHISSRTVSNHLYHVYNKLGVRGRTGAVIVSLMKGEISPHP